MEDFIEMNWPAVFCRIFDRSYSLEAWLDLLGFHPLTIELAWHYARGSFNVDWLLRSFYFLKKYPKGTDAAYNLRTEGQLHDQDHFESQVRRVISRLSETFPHVRSFAIFSVISLDLSLSWIGAHEKWNQCLTDS